MVSKNHKINHKSQGNNSVKSFIVLKCIQPVFVLTYVFDKQQRRWKLFLPSCCSQGGWNRWRDEEISRWCYSFFFFFQKNSKVFLAATLRFRFKNSHGFFNTNIFYSDFFGWSIWLIMVGFCNCSVVNVSHGNTIRRLVQQALGSLWASFPSGCEYIMCQ